MSAWQVVYTRTEVDGWLEFRISGPEGGPWLAEAFWCYGIIGPKDESFDPSNLERNRRWGNHACDACLGKPRGVGPTYPEAQTLTTLEEAKAFCDVGFVQARLSAEKERDRYAKEANHAD